MSNIRALRIKKEIVVYLGEQLLTDVYALLNIKPFLANKSKFGVWQILFRYDLISKPASSAKRMKFYISYINKV
jgi:hypothetical protein